MLSIQPLFLLHGSSAVLSWDLPKRFALNLLIIRGVKGGLPILRFVRKQGNFALRTKHPLLRASLLRIGPVRIERVGRIQMQVHRLQTANLEAEIGLPRGIRYEKIKDLRNELATFKVRPSLKMPLIKSTYLSPCIPRIHFKNFHKD